jgi:hypothetical protein
MAWKASGMTLSTIKKPINSEEFYIFPKFEWISFVFAICRFYKKQKMPCLLGKRIWDPYRVRKGRFLYKKNRGTAM